MDTNVIRMNFESLLHFSYQFLRSKKSSSAQVFSDSDSESGASSEDESAEEVSEDSDTGEQEDKDQLDKETEDLKVRCVFSQKLYCYVYWIDCLALTAMVLGSNTVFDNK